MEMRVRGSRRVGSGPGREVSYRAKPSKSFPPSPGAFVVRVLSGWPEESKCYGTKLPPEFPTMVQLKTSTATRMGSHHSIMRRKKFGFGGIASVDTLSFVHGRSR